MPWIQMVFIEGHGSRRPLKPVGPSEFPAV